jgi:hypothetical protein
MAIAVLHESTIEDRGPSRPSGTTAAATDRRAQVRLTAEDASWLLGARLKYGPEVRVIDISTGGVLIEADGPPLSPHSTVVFELSAEAGTMLMPARVLRSQLLAGGVRHQSACAFKRPLSIATLAAVTRHEAPAPAAAAAAARVGWQRVVARFRNGTVVRGYTNDFHPSKPHLHLTSEDTNSDATFVVVSQLKALFSVRDFAGDPSRVDSTEFDAANHGRKVEVTFEDGEVMRGTTLGYRNDGTGFFVQPADTGSNNMRVFVAPGAARSVKFL